jgi:VanZ family protein
MLSGQKNKMLLLITGAALICTLLLFVGMPGLDYPRSYYHFWDLGHLLNFALWTYLYVTLRPASGYWSQLLLVVLLVFLLGGSSELIQGGLGRSASWRDLAKDLLGGLLVMAFWAPARQSVKTWHLKLLQLLVAVLVVFSLLPLARVLTDELIARQQFPLLSGFEISSEAARWGGGSRQVLDHQIAYSGESSLRVELSTQLYSGVGLKHFPADWSGYRLVRLHLYNPDVEPLELYFRIHDQLHRLHDSAHSDRFNSSFTLPQGWTKIEIPLAQVAAAPKNRSLEMTRIAGMLLFVGKLERPRSFNIDEVLLVR